MKRTTLSGRSRCTVYDIASHRGRSLWLCGLFVRARFRGRGTGQLLVRRIEEYAAANGMPRIWVFTERAAASSGAADGSRLRGWPGTAITDLASRRAARCGRVLAPRGRVVRMGSDGRRC